MLYLSGYDHLEALEAFRNGWIQVQDLSSGLVGRWQQLKKRFRCWMCARPPGGKSLHIAESVKWGSGP